MIRKLLDREPTEEMVAAGYLEVGAMHYSPTADQGWGTHARRIFTAMWTVAPLLDLTELYEAVELAAIHASNERAALEHPRNESYLDGLDATVAKARATLKAMKEEG